MDKEMCRTCCSSSSELVLTQLIDCELLEILKSLTGLTFEDETTSAICQDCIEFLYQCEKFKRKCVESDEKYRFSELIIKEEFTEDPVIQEFEVIETLTDHDVSFKTEELETEECVVIQKKKRSGKSSKSKKEIISPESSLNDTKKPKNPTLCCELCGKFLVGSGSLKKHMMSHYGIKDHVCDICNKSFITKWKLQEHMNRHKGIKKFECEQCGLKKTTLHELKVHINYHTKEKLYKCDYCDLSFTSMGNRGRHTKVVHLGIKAFVCKFCSQSFGKKETLVHHEARHTGEKKHRCEICHKKFIQLVALRTHMKTHNRIVTTNNVETNSEVSSGTQIETH